MSRKKRRAPRPLSVYQQLGFTKRERRQINRNFRRYKKTFFQYGGLEEDMASKLEVATRVITSRGQLTASDLGLWQAVGYSPAQLQDMLDKYNEAHGTDLTLEELVAGGYTKEKKLLAKQLNDQLKQQGIEDGTVRARIISKQIYGSE